MLKWLEFDLQKNRILTSRVWIRCCEYFSILVHTCAVPILPGVPLRHDPKDELIGDEVVVITAETVEVQYKSDEHWVFVYYPKADKKGYVSGLDLFTRYTLKQVDITGPVNQNKIDELDDLLEKKKETKIINLLKTFYAAEREFVYDNRDTYKQKFIDCMNTKEMRNVVVLLKFPLSVKLDWMIDNGTNAKMVFSAVETVTEEEIDDYVVDITLQTRLADEIGEENEQTFRQWLIDSKNEAYRSPDALGYQKRRKDRRGLFGSVQPDFGALKIRNDQLVKRLEGTENILNYVQIYPWYEVMNLPGTDARKKLDKWSNPKPYEPWEGRVMETYLPEYDMMMRDQTTDTHEGYADRVLREELELHNYATKDEYMAEVLAYDAVFTEYAVAEAHDMLNRNEQIVIAEINRYYEDVPIQEIYDAFATVRDPYDKVKAKEIRAGLIPKFPILNDESIDLKDLVKADKDKLRKILTGVGSDRLKDIDKTRENLKEDPNLVYEFEQPLAQAKAALGIDPAGTDVFFLIVTSSERSHHLGKAAVKIGKAALQIGLSFLGPPGAILAFGVGVGMVADEIAEYNIASAARGTAFDKAQALTANEPSKFWLAVSIIGTVLDGLAAASAFAKLSRSVYLIAGKPVTATKDAFKAEVRTTLSAINVAEDGLRMMDNAIDAQVTGAANDIGHLLWDGVPLVDDIGKTGQTRKVFSLFNNSGGAVYSHMKMKLQEVIQHVLGGGTTIDEKKWSEVVEAIRKTDLPEIIKRQIVGKLFWEQVNVAKYKNMGYQVFYQVTLRDTKSKVKAVLDIVAKKGEEIIYDECKTGNAILSDEQKIIYNLLETNPSQLEGLGTNANLAFGNKGAIPKAVVKITDGEGI